MTIPMGPAVEAAPPVKAVAVGFIVADGFEPFIAILLTINDGQGLVSVGIGMLRVIDLSGTAVGQDVPQGADTVETDCSRRQLLRCFKNFRYNG